MNWRTPAPIRFFQTQIVHKNEGLSRIRTWIVGVEGEHTDHLTNTSAQKKNKVPHQ